MNLNRGEVRKIGLVDPVRLNPQNGRRLIPATKCFYPPAINFGDLLLVNFDNKGIDRNGLYLLEEVSKCAAITWRGCRRFRLKPLTNEVWMDVSGDGEWRAMPDLSPYGWRVAGYVEEVYSPARSSAKTLIAIQ